MVIVDDEGNEVEELWEGTYHGYGYEDGTSISHIVGHGRGALEGMQVKWTSVFEPGVYPITLTGRILDPHGE